MSIFENLSLIKANSAFIKNNFTLAIDIYDKQYRKRNTSLSFKIKYASTAIYCNKCELCKEILDDIDYDSLNNANLKIAFKDTEGKYEWKMGNIEKAISIFKALHHNNKSLDVYGTLGYLLIINKSYEEALDYNLEAYDYDNDNNIILDNLGESYYFLKDYDKSYEIYNKIFNKDPSEFPTFPEAYYYYGLILNKKKDFT